MENKNSSLKKFNSGSVISISIAHLLHDIYSSFLAPILPLLIEKLGISYSLVSLLSFIQKAPNIINPFIGLLADKIQMRFMVIITPVATAIVMSLLGLATSYAMLAILLFIMGISASLFHVPAPVMIKKSSSGQLGKGMSFFMVGGELARTLGPLIIVGAVSHWGLEGTYKLIPFGLMASVILFFKLRNIDIREDFRKEKVHVSYTSTFRKFLPTFLTLGFIIFFRGAMKSALTLYLSVYLTDKGNSLWFAGIALSVIQFSGVIGTLTAGTFSDRIGRRTAMVIITAASPLLMWFFLHSEGMLTFPILIITGFFLVAPGPVMLAIVQELDTKHLAFVNGIFMTISFGLGSLMLLIVGILSDKFGMDITYAISGFVALLAIPFALMLPKKQRVKK